MRICRVGINLESYLALTPEDHTGSRANGWLSEIDRQSHTCLMDTRIHAIVGKVISVTLERGKAMGLQQVSFEHA